jgi:hypothetical protein
MILGSTALFYFFLYYLSVQETQPLFDTLPQLISFKNQWFGLFFVLCCYILVEYGLNILENSIINQIEDDIQELKTQQEEEKYKAMQNRKRRVTNYQRKYTLLFTIDFLLM